MIERKATISQDVTEGFWLTASDVTEGFWLTASDVTEGFWLTALDVLRNNAAQASSNILLAALKRLLKTPVHFLYLVSLSMQSEGGQDLPPSPKLF